MSIGFNSNITSVVAQRYLARSTDAIGASFERLASGQRINRARDDAAGLAIATSLNAKSRVYTQAHRNANDAISALAIAEGGLGELTSVVIRLQELATGAANGPLGLSQRRSSDTEAYQLVQEFNRIVSTTSFNGQNLIDGRMGQLGIQLGIGSNEVLGLALGNGLARNVGTGAYSNQSTATNIELPAGSGATADFNGDGKLDVIISNFSLSVIIKFGDGNGGFTSETGLTLAGIGIREANQVVVGDFNGDGKQDFAASTNDDGIQVFMGNGNGTFSGAVQYSDSTQRTGLIATDLNNDGRVDLVSGSGGSLFAYYGTGTGAFSGPSTISSGLGSILNLTGGDFNGDGCMDVVAFDGSGTGSIALGNQSGSLTHNGTFSISSATGYITSGDVNHDGILDLVVSNSNSVKVVRGNGNGTFGAITSYSVANADSVTSLVDMNGDGNLDILVGSSTGGSQGNLSVLNNNGDGTFANPFNIAISSTGTAPRLVPGDFNGDGVVDAAYFDLDDNLLSGIMTQGATKTTTIGRIDLTTRSGALSSLDILKLISQRITTELGAIGAFQSRLSSALSTLSTRSENYLAASGRIVNADIGFESAELVRQQIKQQAAAAVLAQANQVPVLALSLLR